jgi:hypothetical protein
MRPDPIVEEIHRIREQMWDECGGNLDRLIDSLRASEATHQDRIASPAQLKSIQGQMERASGEPKPS